MMSRSVTGPIMAAAIVALAGCAARIPPVEVTRFHLGQPIAAGTVAVDMAGMDGPEGQNYVNAVESELTRLGYLRADQNAAAYIATVRINRGVRETTARRSPVSIGLGGGTGGYRSGIGLGLGFNIGGRPKPTVVTELSVQLKNRLKGEVVWEGRAQTAARANAPAAQPGLAASKLATALFNDFPGESGRTIWVP